MESTVINQQPQENQSPTMTGSNNNTAAQQTHVGGGGSDQQQQPSGGGGRGDVHHHENIGHNDDPRFRSGHNPFFFDMDDPRDFFTNPALRTRLSRFQNPWNSSFGQRKRRTSPPSTPVGAATTATGGDTHPTMDDFFMSHFDAPHWNEPRGWPPMNGGARKRMQDLPERGQKSNADMFNYIPEEFRQYMPEKFGFHHQQQQQPQAPPRRAPPQSPPTQQQAYAQRNNSGDLRRPQFCDAGMQTDDISPSESGSSMPAESEGRPQQQQQQSPQQSAEPNYQQPPNQQSGFGRTSVDAGVGNSPNGSFASANAYASTGGGGAGNNDGQRQTRSNSNSMGNVRRVPIIVEGQPSSFPKESYMPHRSPPNRQAPPQQPEPPQPPKRAHPPTPPTAREVPIQRPAEPPSPSVESINKIQDIQQDVLNLMFKVEQYQGSGTKDKEYKFLDEMLTRNLLKLDTIDTRGNDSIRLARKEAIKCIQASLSVLEAKGKGLVVDTGAGSAMSTGEEAVEEGVSQEQAKEKVEEDEHEEKKNEGVTEDPEAAEVVDKSKIPIPLPPVPGQVPAPTIRDCNSDDEDAPPVYVVEKTVELKPKKKNN